MLMAGVMSVILTLVLKEKVLTALSFSLLLSLLRLLHILPSYCQRCITASDEFYWR